MTLYGIPPASMRRTLAPEDGRDHARDIAATARAWWLENRGGAGDLPIALGALAGLALAAPSRAGGPDYGQLPIPLNDEELVDALRAVWNSLWAYNPALADAATPLHAWLAQPSGEDLRGLGDYTRVLVRAGMLEFCSDVARCESDDLLGRLVQQMRGYGERQKTGEFFTPAGAADTTAEVALPDDLELGAQFLEPCAGTGTMARAAAATLRLHGRSPADYRWWLNDLDPLNSACCAVNAQLWRLGRAVVVSCGNSLGDPKQLAKTARERAERAIAEQQQHPLLYPTRTRPPLWPF
ncbi:hypothetical protein ACWEQL_00475 [Kitasatospora sp. NPDC004240]